MQPVPRTIVGDLADWDLPSLDRHLDVLIESLQRRKIQITLDEDTLYEHVYAHLYGQIREVGATAANEAIFGWLQGCADGCPELCVQFPYLQGADKQAEPLTITYSVGACDGSRAELKRIDLEEALTETLEVDTPLVPLRSHVLAMARRLRTLADQLEERAESLRSGNRLDR